MKAPVPLSHQDAETALVDSGWRREGEELIFEETFDSFVEAIRFVDTVAEIAERQDHHPDIDIRWRTVVLRVTTHQINGLSSRDLEFAQSVIGR